MKQRIKKLPDGFDVPFHVQRTKDLKFMVNWWPLGEFLSLEFTPKIEFLQVRHWDKFVDGLEFLLLTKMSWTIVWGKLWSKDLFECIFSLKYRFGIGSDFGFKFFDSRVQFGECFFCLL